MLRKRFEGDWLIGGKQLVTMTALGAALAAAAPGGARIVSAAENSTIFVSNVDQLYAEVNDAENAGAAIVLSPGVYTLSAIDASGVLRPNGGRLDLQTDMSLRGLVGDSSAVVIDPFPLPDSSFRDSKIPGRTGVFRVGRGSNAIEWLTIGGSASNQGNRFAAAAIETDLVEAGEDGPRPTSIRIGHVIAGGIARGVDIRNITATMAGRRLQAEIADNQFFWGVEGIRVINFQGAHRGNITVTMSGNRSYANRLGCIIENNRSDFAIVSVVSSGDRFDDNGLGCQLGGGLVAGPGQANFNTTKFEGYGSEFTNNTRNEFNPNVTGPEFRDRGGLIVAAGDVALAGQAYSASGNTLLVRFTDVIVAGNHPYDDFNAFGASCTTSSCLTPLVPLPAGTDNHTLIHLRGVSNAIAINAVDSEPPDPTGTNTVTVVRAPAPQPPEQ